MQLISKVTFQGQKPISLESMKADLKLMEIVKGTSSSKPQEFSGVTSTASSPKK